jgi:hypothetical protein
MTQESAQFIINLDGFVSVKKLTVESKTTIEDIIEYLGSVQFTSSQKIKDYIDKLIDTKTLLEEIKDLFNNELSIFYNELNSRKTKTLIAKILPAHLEKKQKDAYIEAVKVYLLNIFCEKNNLILNYGQILFPSKKKLMKPKIQKK